MRAAKQTNVDLEAWAHHILDKPLNRSSRTSQLISPAHRESPAPPRSSSRDQYPPGRRTSTAERSSSERGTERQPAAPLQHAPFPTRTSSHAPASGRQFDEKETIYHTSAGDPSRGNQLPQSKSSRQAQHRSNTEPVGLPTSDRGDNRERYSRDQDGEREKGREREYAQGTIGIGFEGARQPEMKEKRKLPPVGVMTSGNGLSYGGGNGIGSGINSGPMAEPNGLDQRRR